MPPLPTVPGVYRCALEWTGPNSTSAVNVMHFYAPTGTIAGLRSALEANVVANMWHSVVSGATITRTAVLPLDGVSGTSEENTSGGAKWSGTQAGEAILAAAHILTLSTGLRGRDKRGRLFLPFVGEAAYITGATTITSRDAMQAAWTAFLDAMGLAGYDLTIMSYRYVRHTPVGGIVVQNTYATQRRRQSRFRKARGL